MRPDGPNARGNARLTVELRKFLPFTFFAVPAHNTHVQSSVKQSQKMADDECFRQCGKRVGNKRNFTFHLVGWWICSDQSLGCISRHYLLNFKDAKLPQHRLMVGLSLSKCFQVFGSLSNS